MADAGTTAKAGQVTVARLMRCLSMVHSYSRVRQRRPGRSRWPLVAHVVLGRRHSQRRPHPSRVAGETRLARGGYGGNTRTLLDRLELMTYPKAHQRPPKATCCVLKCGGPLDRVQLTVCLHRPEEPYMTLGGTCL